jgi:hypothetical protein
MVINSVYEPLKYVLTFKTILANYGINDNNMSEYDKEALSQTINAIINDNLEKSVNGGSAKRRNKSVKGTVRKNVGKEKRRHCEGQMFL